MAFTNERQAATEGENSKFITLTEGDDTFSNVAVEDDDSSDKPVVHNLHGRRRQR